MVRRFMRRFFRWVKRLSSRLRSSQQRRYHAPPIKRLPTSTQTNVAQVSPQPSPAVSQPTSKQLADLAPSASQSPQQPLNPASNRAPSSSNFEVLLSDYSYTPSPAVQELSQQLFHPNPEPSPTIDPWKPEQTVAATDSVVSQPASDTQLPKETIEQTTIEQTQSTEKIAAPQEPAINTVPIQEKTSTQANEQTPPTLPPIDLAPERPPAQDPPIIERSPQIISPPQISSTQPASITKQGFVKLLFKIKKNNFHGYITPKDGSKDIIFHQKYINDDVFCRLERGMEVEVTAHITEGKAYADHVRIL